MKTDVHIWIALLSVCITQISAVDYLVRSNYVANENEGDNWLSLFNSTGHVCLSVRV